MKENKSRPLLLWVILWIFGILFITIKNRMAAGVSLQAGDIIVGNLVMDIIVIPAAIIAYYIIKFIASLVGFKGAFDGEKGIKSVFLVWCVFFFMIFLIPLFRR